MKIHANKNVPSFSQKIRQMLPPHKIDSRRERLKACWESNSYWYKTMKEVKESLSFFVIYPDKVIKTVYTQHMSSPNLFFPTQWFENDQEYVKFLSKQICWRYKPISILAISHFWYDILIILLVFGSLTTSIENNQLLFSYCFLTTAEYSWNFFSLNKIWLQHTNRDHGTIRTCKSSTSPVPIFRKFCLLILALNSIKSTG